MLDERTNCLLKIINEKCSEGSFKILSSDELVLAFPKRFVADGDLIRQMINALSIGGYLSLRYDKDGEYCLAPTPKGRQSFEEGAQVSKIVKKPFTAFFSYFYTSIAVFVGVLSAYILLWVVGIC